MKKNFIYMPSLGLIEAGETPDDAIERINRAEVQQEIAEKKLLKKLKRLYPNSNITKIGSLWRIDTNKPFE